MSDLYLNLRYNSSDIKIPLSTKINDLSDLISQQLENKINTIYKVYFNGIPINANERSFHRKSPHNIYIDDENVNMTLTDIHDKLLNEIKSKTNNYTPWIDLYVPSTKTKLLNEKKTMNLLGINHIIFYVRDKLNHNPTLYEYGLRSNDMIKIGPHNDTFQIFVRFDSITVVNVYHSMKIEDLLLKFQGIYFNTIDQVYLTYCANTLDLTKTIYECDILENATIYLHGRLR